MYFYFNGYYEWKLIKYNYCFIFFSILICFFTDRLTVVNLRDSTAYQIQIRHLSRRARNPLWSDWSPLVIVPTGEVIQVSGFFAWTGQLSISQRHYENGLPWHHDLCILNEWMSEHLTLELQNFRTILSSPLETLEQSLWILQQLVVIWFFLTG